MAAAPARAAAAAHAPGLGALSAATRSYSTPSGALVSSLRGLCAPATVDVPSPSANRATIAAVFRVRASPDEPATPNSPPPLSGDGGGLDVLFIKRAVRKGDRWSGQVAFPGGRNAPGETSLDAVRREVREELGIELHAQSSFENLGYYKSMTRTGPAHLTPLEVACYVFMQHPQESDDRATSPQDISPEPNEVAMFQWTPLEFFLDEARLSGHEAKKSAIQPPKSLPVVLQHALRPLYEAVGPPGLVLPHDASRRAVSLEQTPPAAGAVPAHAGDEMLLWGMTLNLMVGLCRDLGSANLHTDLHAPRFRLGRALYEAYKRIPLGARRGAHGYDTV